MHLVGKFHTKKKYFRFDSNVTTTNHCKISNNIMLAKPYYKTSLTLTFFSETFKAVFHLVIKLQLNGMKKGKFNSRKHYISKAQMEANINARILIVIFRKF